MSQIAVFIVAAHLCNAQTTIDWPSSRSETRFSERKALQHRPMIEVDWELRAQKPRGTLFVEGQRHQQSSRALAGPRWTIFNFPPCAMVKSLLSLAVWTRFRLGQGMSARCIPFNPSTRLVVMSGWTRWWSPNGVSCKTKTGSAKTSPSCPKTCARKPDSCARA